MQLLTADNRDEAAWVECGVGKNNQLSSVCDDEMLDFAVARWNINRIAVKWVFLS